jgi:membrane protein YdbS with pleckstrin-like domain
MGDPDLKGAAGERLLKAGVVLLCSINAVMWEFYTQSTVMALFWAAIAITFVIWIGKDMNR